MKFPAAGVFPETRADGVFPQTRWSVVLDAQGDDPAALATLCGSYWLPLYKFARRKGMSVADAEDLTQAFFERLLARDLLGSARQERGKLRDFLLKCFSRFAAEEWRKAGAQKRGGGRPVVTMDVQSAEAQLAMEPRHHLTPEIEFERSWARTLLSQAFETLRSTYRDSGKEPLFRALEDQLVEDASASGHREIGAALGMSEAAVRFAAFKLRQRFRDILYRLVADTVSTPDEAAAELTQLRTIFERRTDEPAR